MESFSWAGHHLDTQTKKPTGCTDKIPAETFSVARITFKLYLLKLIFQNKACIHSKYSCVIQKIRLGTLGLLMQYSFALCS